MPTAAIDKFDYLPTVSGPKLGRFRNGRYKKIEFLELLGLSDDAEESPDGVHGHVFRVRIDSEPFALKIFRFFDPETTRAQLGPVQNRRISDEDIEGHTDPFYAECRAYGRIASRPRKRPIAVACHGFLSLPAKWEDYFARRFNVADWDRPEEELSVEPAQRQPFRALVKDLVETDPEITDKLLKSMLRELRALHSLKVYVMDISWQNYKGGHLVDFSSSFTEPHCMFRRDVRARFEIGQFRNQDFYDFDEMVKELGIQTTAKARKDEETMAKLRTRK